MSTESKHNGGRGPWRDGLSPEETAALDKLAERKAAGVAIYADLIAAFRRKPRRWEAVMGPDRIDFGASAPPLGTRLEVVEILED